MTDFFVSDESYGDDECLWPGGNKGSLKLLHSSFISMSNILGRSLWWRSEIRRERVVLVPRVYADSNDWQLQVTRQFQLISPIQSLYTKIRAYTITETLNPATVVAGNQVIYFLPSSNAHQASAVILQPEQTGSHPLFIVFQIPLFIFYYITHYSIICLWFWSSVSPLAPFCL